MNRPSPLRTTARTITIVLSLALASACNTPASSGTDSSVDTDASSVRTDASAGNDAAPAIDTGVDTGGRADDASVDTGRAVDAAATDTASSTIDAGRDGGGTVNCAPRTFVVLAPGFSYTIDGVAGNPALTLCRGVTYTFDLTAVGPTHPIAIFTGATMSAVLPAGMTSTYSVPLTAPFPNRYACQFHGFGSTVSVP